MQGYRSSTLVAIMSNDRSGGKVQCFLGYVGAPHQLTAETRLGGLAAALRVGVATSQVEGSERWCVDKCMQDCAHEAGVA